MDAAILEADQVQNQILRVPYLRSLLAVWVVCVPGRVLAQSSPTPEVEAITTLVAFLKQAGPTPAEFEQVRTAAAEALGKIPSSAPELVKLVSDKTLSDVTRKSGIHALSLMGNKVPAGDKGDVVKAIVAIIAEKKDDFTYVLLAVEALGNLCS